ncbi:MAG: hypothetical protein ACE5EC_02125 [Phycisphaerae bacterium]
MMIRGRSPDVDNRSPTPGFRAVSLLSFSFAIAVTGCGTPQTVTLDHYEHEDPVQEYMLNWQPERNYRPGFVATGALKEPPLGHMIVFYGHLAQVKDLVFEERHSEARQVLQRMQRMNLPLERDNILRMLAIIDRQMEKSDGR